ncbi:MAG: nucleotide exchange factor GrpE [Rhodocyclales bacterium RIFCSPLOWO2_02_FULL_63_24]|nr:MAG: nucleotide exchange factor GrpE [Rhodocyclales bacterium RIFCSPLOWO2_02_FULL_63_24]
MQENSATPSPTQTTEALPDLNQQGSTADAAAAPAPTVDPVTEATVMPSLEEMLKAAELKAAEHHDAWLRAKAETENVRRRAQEDIGKAGKFAVEKFSGELLAVKDSLEAALANENQSAENLKAGVELTLRQLVSAFEKSSLAEINPLGQKFDPHQHQAISQIEAPDESTEANTVLNVLQKGYALHGRVIRPALVVVSKTKSAPAA